MKEPLNIKLLFLYLLKRIWILFAGAAVMAALFGGIYYLKNFVFAPEAEYKAVSQLYLTYADDVRLENVYINDYTWQTLSASDACVDEALKHLSFECSREDLRNAAVAGLESDVRLVTLTVTAKSPEQALEIAHAYEIAIQKLGEKMVDVKEVQIFTSADHADKVEWDNRTLRMSITGGIVGFMFALVGLLFAFAVDDSVYLPETMEIRYGIKTLACFSKNGEPVDNWSKDASSENLGKVTENKSKIYVTDISAGGLKKEELEKYLGQISRSGSLVFVESIQKDATIVKEMENSDGVIVFVRAGAGGGKMIERGIRYLETQEIPILGAVLFDTDKGLMLRYLGRRGQ